MKYKREIKTTKKLEIRAVDSDIGGIYGIIKLDIKRGNTFFKGICSLFETSQDHTKIAVDQQNLFFYGDNIQVIRNWDKRYLKKIDLDAFEEENTSGKKEGIISRYWLIPLDQVEVNTRQAPLIQSVASCIDETIREMMPSLKRVELDNLSSLNGSHTHFRYFPQELKQDALRKKGYYHGSKKVTSHEIEHLNIAPPKGMYVPMGGLPGWTRKTRIR